MHGFSATKWLKFFSNDYLLSQISTREMLTRQFLLEDFLLTGNFGKPLGFCEFASANLEPCNPRRPALRKWWHTILERFRVFFCFWEVDLSFSVPVRQSKSNLLSTTTSSTLSVMTQLAISEFQKLSLSKRGQVQNLSCENEVYLYGNKKSFSIINGFTLSLALKERLEPTSKRPIEDKNVKIIKITAGACFQTETAVFII